MTFKKIDKIENVQNCLIQKTNILITNQRNELFLNNSLISENVFFYTIYNDILIYDFGRTLNLVNLKNDEKIILSSRSSALFDSKSGNILLSSNSNQNTCTLSVYCISSNIERIIEKEYKWESGIIFNRVFYFFGNSYVKSLSLKAGEYEWEIDLGNRSFENCGEIESIIILQIIGVSGNDLMVFLSDHSLISIDTTTGKTLWEFSREAIYEVWKGGKNFTTDFFRSGHIENHQLFVMKGNSYFVFDIATQTVQWLWQAKEHYEDINIVATVFTEDYIYFTACYGTLPFNPNLLGVFNRKTLEIEWLHDGSDLPTISGYQGSFRQIQVTENKLYALDNSGLTYGTLHIFEKAQKA